MENPCISCITLAMCKARVAEGGPAFLIAWTGKNCSLFRDYVTTNARTIDVERANELGKLFGYCVEQQNSHSCIIKNTNEKKRNL